MTGDCESAAGRLRIGCLAAAEVEQTQTAAANCFAAFGLGEWHREDQGSPLQFWRALKKKGLSDLAQGEEEEVVGADDGVEEGAAVQQSALGPQSARKADGACCALGYQSQIYAAIHCYVKSVLW